MTEPATLPDDEPGTIRSGGHGGLVAVHNPLDGTVELVDPDVAADRVYSAGWQPVSKADATRADAHQILKESIRPDQAIGLGLERGVTAGLSDLLPESDEYKQLNAATDEQFPWLTPIAEGAGMLAPFGVGGALGAVGEGVTGALRGGEELGFLGKVGSRAAGMGAEGAAYGGIGAARESAINDDPLTAQKLLSGMFGGGIVGGVLGGGVGALEGSGSLIRGMFKNSSAAREELNAPGLRDSDISPIMERAGLGPMEPGALQELQAMLYNDPNITPEFLAAMGKSKGIRDDVMLAAGPQRAAAEAEFADALNKLHDGNQDALAGWEGQLKRDKIANWIGPESEHVSDAGNLIQHLDSLDIPSRFELSQRITKAVDTASRENPMAFAELMNGLSATSREEALHSIDRALLHNNEEVLDQLFNSKLLNDENISKLEVPTRQLEVPTRPDLSAEPVTRAASAEEGGNAQQALRDVLKTPKLEPIEPTWKRSALDFVDRQDEVLGELAMQPKGYVAGKGGGQVKKLQELMAGARQSIKEGDRVNAFIELDRVKKRLAALRGSGRVPAEEAVRLYAGNMHEEARLLLEDSGIWGAKAANAQKEMNAILHQRFTRDGDFYKAFYSGAGMPDPKNPWTEKLVADPAKIRAAMDRLGNPERSMELQQFKKHITESKQLADVMEKYYAPDEAQNAVIKSMRDGVDHANAKMDDALHYALRANQGKVLSEAAHGGARGMASHFAAYALGGPLGVAGALVGRALMNPGRMWRMQAIVERMMGSHGGRVADGLARIVGGATKTLGGVAKSSTRVLGSAMLLTQDIEKRQQAYGDTLHDLAAMASNRDAVVKAISSWHGPDFAHLPNAIPAMSDALMRGAQFCLQVAPARPQPGMFSDDELGLISDSEAEEFSNTVHAAMDPASIYDFLADGKLTPQILKAAETTAPELVDDMRQQTIQMFTTTTGNVKIAPVQKAGLAILLGVTPSPLYLQALQTSWQSNQTNPSQKVSPGNLGDTGVNERYSKSTYSVADRLESGEHQL